MKNPTMIMSQELHRAFDFFNEELFQGQLPSVILNLHKEKGAYGVFRNDSWVHNEDGSMLHSIHINPIYNNRQKEDLLSTLVHEMVHLQQQVFGKPSKGAYHNKQWVNLMENIGLIPVSTKDRSKQTGTSVTHSIDPEGLFSESCSKFLNAGFDLSFVNLDQAKKKTKKTRSKTKYTCPNCKSSVWGKPDLNIECSDCGLPFIESTSKEENA